MNIIRIDQNIGYDPWWDAGISSASVRQQLAGMNNEDVTVYINSPGGDVLEGSAIYTALREYPGKVTVKVEALAASAASVIAMAADTLLMSPTSYLMIHRASTIAAGNVDAMDETARQLRAIDNGIIEAYRLKTGMSRAKLLKMMEEETWLNARTAVDMGFADAILFTDSAAPDEGEQEEEEAAGETTIHAVASLHPLLFSHASMTLMHGPTGRVDAPPIIDKVTSEEDPEEDPEETEAEDEPEEEKPEEEETAEDAPEEEQPEEDDPEEQPEEDEPEEDEPDSECDKDKPDDEEKAVLQARLALCSLLIDFEGGYPE